ncbi:MAG: Ferripyoverdine receptor precursor [Verrucomicrobiota bacterium]|jgi:outer membrane receptor protein involved in Fe transport
MLQSTSTPVAVKTPLLFCVFVAAVTSVAAVAYSQTTPVASAKSTTKDEPVQLSAFEVTTSSDIGYLSTHTADATRMNVSIDELPMNVTVFNQKFIDDLGATTTSELMAYEPSALKTEENDNFQMRGSNSVNMNYLNGSAITGGFGPQSLSNIERVEVMRGPDAVINGAGGYGGTVNRVTKQPTPKPFTSWRIGIYDEHSFRVEGDANFGQIAAWRRQSLLFRLVGARERGTTWFGTPRKEDSLSPTLRWNIADRTSLTLQFTYNWTETRGGRGTAVHGTDPEGMVTGDGVWRRTATQNNYLSVASDHRRNARKIYSADFRHAFSERLQFRGLFMFDQKRQNNLETQPDVAGLAILKDVALVARNWGRPDGVSP